MGMFRNKKQIDRKIATGRRPARRDGKKKWFVVGVVLVPAWILQQ